MGPMWRATILIATSQLQQIIGEERSRDGV